MRAYITRRVLLLIPTFLLLSILVFLSVRFIPGDVIDVLEGRMNNLVQIDREAVERCWAWTSQFMCSMDAG